MSQKGKTGEEAEEGAQIIQCAIKSRNKESVTIKQKNILRPERKDGKGEPIWKFKENTKTGARDEQHEGGYLWRGYLNHR